MSDPDKRSPFAKLAALREQLPEAKVSTPKPAPSPPPSDLLTGRIVVRKERKGRGGKTVTVLQGLRGSADEREALAQELRKAMGCGGALEADADGAPLLVLQGELVERCVSWLVARGARDVRKGT